MGTGLLVYALLAPYSQPGTPEEHSLLSNVRPLHTAKRYPADLVSLLRKAVSFRKVV